MPISETRCFPPHLKPRERLIDMLPITMTSPLLRLLGALAGLGSAILCWFLGNTLASPIRQHTFFDLDGSHYALMAFLLVPALTLAVVACSGCHRELRVADLYRKAGDGESRWC